MDKFNIIELTYVYVGIKMTEHKISEVIRRNKRVSFAFFNVISNMFAVVFVIMIWVQIAVAGKNAQRVVFVFWNHFGEYHLEVVFFGIIGVLIITNTIFSIRKIKQLKEEKQNI